MAGRLSEDEMKRIAQFAKTPKYKRSPDHLLPEDSE